MYGRSQNNYHLNYIQNVAHTVLFLFVDNGLAVALYVELRHTFISANDNTDDDRPKEGYGNTLLTHQNPQFY